MSRSNVGGVFSVEMWLAKDSGRVEPPTSLDCDMASVRVPVISAQSQYSEQVTVNQGIRLVEHTLTLVTEATDNFWGDMALEDAERVGCIAEVVLSSYGRVLLGWSPNLGYEQPLRLTKVSTQSSDSVDRNCVKSWIFKSYSTQPLI